MIIKTNRPLRTKPNTFSSIETQTATTKLLMLTPSLDIKPYLPVFFEASYISVANQGRQEKKKRKHIRRNTNMKYNIT